MYKLGIDVGGTNTDAVLIDEDLRVVAQVKYPTTGNVFEGIMGAVERLLNEAQVDRTQIRQAMLGTTQCTNSIVERKNLAKIGLLRIGAPATLGVPPMVDWAQDIRFICEKSAVIAGGFEYDGKELAPLDEEAARAFFRELRGKVESVAISCVFSTVRNDHELRCAQICREVMGEKVHISISSEIGSMGLIERENATILNAALYQVAERFTEGFAYADPNLESVQAQVDQNTCAVMIELIQGEGGVCPLDKGFVQALAAFCKERDILLVVDEVQTGVGRTGKLYCYEHYGVQPDVITSAPFLNHSG